MVNFFMGKGRQLVAFTLSVMLVLTAVPSNFVVAAEVTSEQTEVEAEKTGEADADRAVDSGYTDKADADRAGDIGYTDRAASNGVADIDETQASDSKLTKESDSSKTQEPDTDEKKSEFDNAESADTEENQFAEEDIQASATDGEDTEEVFYLKFNDANGQEVTLPLSDASEGVDRWYSSPVFLWTISLKNLREKVMKQ